MPSAVRRSLSRAYGSRQQLIAALKGRHRRNRVLQKALAGAKVATPTDVQVVGLISEGQSSERQLKSSVKTNKGVK